MSKQEVAAKTAKVEKAAKVAEAEIVKPIVLPVNSEKAFRLSHDGIYMFKVPAKMSKQMIAKMVSEGFKVKVLGVTVSVRKGKMTRASKGVKRVPIQIQRPDVRFAYVRLAAGEKLPFFDEQEAELKKATAAEAKTEKAAEKDAKKAEKAEAKAEIKAEKAEKKGKK
ncbi:MAG: 50S ribosomal protein L23 [Candidatus Nomurabacteria bacterium]|jgi:ribosomal protein L23|nr:50S ribosomal protein L23 [Candidatus Nomurabacteria bacterium]